MRPRHDKQLQKLGKAYRKLTEAQRAYAHSPDSKMRAIVLKRMTQYEDATKRYTDTLLLEYKSNG